MTTPFFAMDCLPKECILPIVHKMNAKAFGVFLRTNKRLSTIALSDKKKLHRTDLQVEILNENNNDYIIEFRRNFAFVRRFTGDFKNFFQDAEFFSFKELSYRGCHRGRKENSIARFMEDIAGLKFSCEKLRVEYYKDVADHLLENTTFSSVTLNLPNEGDSLLDNRNLAKAEMINLSIDSCEILGHFEKVRNYRKAVIVSTNNRPTGDLHVEDIIMAARTRGVGEYKLRTFEFYNGNQPKTFSLPNIICVFERRNHRLDRDEKIFIATLPFWSPFKYLLITVYEFMGRIVKFVKDRDELFNRLVKMLETRKLNSSANDYSEFYYAFVYSPFDNWRNVVDEYLNLFPGRR